MATYFSPAKINLFFHISAKRSDGYHELASLFQAISYCDIITIELAEKDCWSCSDASLSMDENNLVVKAIKLFRSKTNLKNTFILHLEKKIPQQAGLGGGSGNAATVLWALNSLLKANVSDEMLSLWAAELGSDISFFFSYGTALCEGRGEKVTNLPALENQNVWVIKPSIGLSTPQVYANFKIPNSSRLDIKKTVDGFYQKNPFYFNDLEEPAFHLMPELEELKKMLLNQGVKVVQLCGSGSALFCLSLMEVPLVSQNNSVAKCRFMHRQKNSWYQ